MSDRLRLTSALVLVVVGMACVLYAVISWHSVEQPPAEPQNVAPIRVDGDEHEASEEPLEEEAPADPSDAPERRESVAPSPAASAPPAAPGRTVAPEKRKEALQLWVLVALPLAFVAIIVLILVQRWVRPRPMPRTGPSDTTDLWQEAGKRLKLE